MIVTIEREEITVLPRVARMIKLLLQNQPFIENHESGQIIIDYSVSQVKVRLPPPMYQEKIPRGERTELTNSKTDL